MTRSDFQNEIKARMGHSLQCKDKANIDPTVIIACKHAQDILDKSLVIDSFLLEALVGHIESVIYERMDVANEKAGVNVARYKGLEFSDIQREMPNNAFEFISYDEIRGYCIEIMEEFEDEVDDQYNKYVSGQPVKGLRRM